MSDRERVPMWWRRAGAALAVVAVLASLGITGRVAAALLGAERWLTPARELGAGDGGTTGARTSCSTRSRRS